MGAEERRQLELQAYHDGELSALRRFWVERRLARDPEARRALEELQGLGRMLRQHSAELGAGEPAVWAGLRQELAYASHPAREVAARPSGSRSRGPAWFGAGLAAAGALALALALLLDPGDASPAGSLRWLRSEGHPTMVLQDDREATIIWVLDDGLGDGFGDGGLDDAESAESSERRHGAVA